MNEKDANYSIKAQEDRKELMIAMGTLYKRNYYYRIIREEDWSHYE